MSITGIQYKAEQLFADDPETADFEGHPTYKLYWRFNGNTIVDAVLVIDGRCMAGKANEPQLRVITTATGDVFIDNTNQVLSSNMDFTKYILVLKHIHDASYKYFSQFEENGYADMHGELLVDIETNALIASHYPGAGIESEPELLDISPDTYKHFFKGDGYEDTAQ